MASLSRVWSRLVASVGYDHTPPAKIKDLALFLINVLHCNYSSILYHVRVQDRAIVTMEDR